MELVAGSISLNEMKNKLDKLNWFGMSEYNMRFVGKY